MLQNVSLPKPEAGKQYIFFLGIPLKQMLIVYMLNRIAVHFVSETVSHPALMVTFH